MIKFLSKMICGSAIKDLEKENQILKEKLAERQETINATNAYWKKKMHNLSKKNKKENKS